MSICGSVKEWKGRRWGVRVGWRVDGGGVGGVGGDGGGGGGKSLLHSSEEKQHL